MGTERIKVPPNGTDFTAVLSPITPTIPTTPSMPGFTPLVTVVGFHHARGPEVESWFGADDGVDPAAKYGWTLLPFMALSDGAHASEEDFSYFTLLRPESDDGPATSLFGISCTRQLDAAQLINRPADVTRSTVQKAVVVIADSPQFFGMLRQRLSVVTQAWFAQREFADVDILRRFQDSLADEKARGILQEEAQRDQYLGMSLRELIHEFKWQALVLFKCCLLQPKMLFFGSRCDRLCMVQFSLISLIPGLIRNLQDCADPELNNHEKKLAQPTSLQSSNRNSLLTFMGLPLQIFGKGSIFGPYTPLQQLDLLADVGTKSYLVGSTNSLLLQQKDRYSDIIINLDDNTISITSPSLRTALSLTAADRRWIDHLTQEVNDTWDESNPSTPKTMQYAGSEEYIRAQFEAYIIGLISSVKFHGHLASIAAAVRSTAESDPAVDFGLDWVEAWMRTENYRMWDAHTDANLFAVSEPKHPCAGGLSIEDVQRRIAEQVKELHLDERFAQGRDILGRNFAAGREKASTMLNRLYSDVEQLREAQRRRADEAAKANEAGKNSGDGISVDTAKAQEATQTVGSRASAYMASWASWAGEKRKNGGWGAGWGKKKADQAASMPTSPIERDYHFVSMLGSRGASTEAYRPMTQESFSESILSAADSDRSADATVPLTQYPREFDDGFHQETLVGNGGTKSVDSI
ncbi:lalv9 family [Trichoderma cornu-damae]|uniref:Lalv9 family n=1 Tax=Trichoderma cornu-damae TaxID=654480 RepID=A0A9P8TWI5_9HYPO|nr:lalv9 family [Trichoderma cornu-damae]